MGYGEVLNIMNVSLFCSLWQYKCCRIDSINVMTSVNISMTSVNGSVLYVVLVQNVDGKNVDNELILISLYAVACSISGTITLGNFNSVSCVVFLSLCFFLWHSY